MAYREFVGVYNAEGSLLGEIRYLIGKLTGTRTCALCDISHILAAEKESFTAFKENFPVPFFNRHLDELDAAQLELAQNRAPCILALDDDGWQVVATRQHLEQCGKSVKKFTALMQTLLE
ncbi:hypothetical protein A3759_09990 [Thalassolituus sp. HI0120]|nr:hypothetical protein A3759_09990 [Thalassolituus sp. HI0120]